MTAAIHISDTSAPRSSTRWRLRVARGIQRIVSAADRLPELLVYCAKPALVVAEALVLGVLRPADVDQMVSDSYEQNQDFYDPRKYRLPHEERLVPELKQEKPSGQLLDAFCGQGREAQLFAREGYTVSAIDRIPWMIVRAEQFAVEADFDATFTVADFATHCPERRFDVVYTSCWMYSTVQGREQRSRFLARCAELCADDGVIIVSYIADHESTVFTAARFLIARVIGLLSGGNRKTEYGERIYSGLFWHHLPTQTVDTELAQAQLKTVRIIDGCGTDPTFRVLRKAAE